MAVAPETYLAQTLALFGWRTLPAGPVDRYPEIALADYAGRVDRVLLSTAQSNSAADRGVTPVTTRAKKPHGAKTEEAPDTPGSGGARGTAPKGGGGAGGQDVTGHLLTASAAATTTTALVLAGLLLAAALAGAALEAHHGRKALFP